MKKVINSEDSMKIWGEKIGTALQGGEFIELIGDIGAGKTTLTKGIAKGLGISETVQSPTFTISRVYEARDNLRLAHYDFYRLADAGIMADELDEVVADTSTITVVEWGDVVSDVKPSDHLTISIVSPTEQARDIQVAAHGERSQRLLERML